MNRSTFSYHVKGILCFLFVISVCWASAQDLAIKSVSRNGNDIIINYDLLDEDLTHKYTLRLYSSQDNFVQPLTNVEGDVGIDQSVGGNKQIIWHAKEEFGDDFKGDVSLELKGKLYIPFVTLNNFEDITSMKKSRPYNVTWAAGRGSSVLTFDLFNGKNEIVHTYINIANVGEYQLEIPKDVKPGKNYRFRITDQRNKEDVVFTPYFTIRRKIPLAAKVGMVGLAGSGLFLLSGSQNPDAGGSEIPLLPDPILPGN